MSHAGFTRQVIANISKFQLPTLAKCMKDAPKLTVKERQQAAHQLLEASKKPYLVRGLARTVLYLTAEQAAKRQDLIPQFSL